MAEGDWRKNLRYYRKKKGKTQSDIAMELNVKQQTIVGYENGPTNPSIDDLLKMTKLLGISIAELFGDITEDERKNPKERQNEKGYLKKYSIDEVENEFSLNEPLPDEPQALYDYLKAIVRIYYESLADIKNRLTELEKIIKAKP